MKGIKFQFQNLTKTASEILLTSQKSASAFHFSFQKLVLESFNVFNIFFQQIDADLAVISAYKDFVSTLKKAIQQFNQQRYVDDDSDDQRYVSCIIQQEQDVEYFLNTRRPMPQISERGDIYKFLSQAESRQKDLQQIMNNMQQRKFQGSNIKKKITIIPLSKKEVNDRYVQTDIEANQMNTFENSYKQIQQIKQTEKRYSHKKTPTQKLETIIQQSNKQNTSKQKQTSQQKKSKTNINSLDIQSSKKNSKSLQKKTRGSVINQKQHTSLRKTGNVSIHVPTLSNSRGPLQTTNTSKKSLIIQEFSVEQSHHSNCPQITQSSIKFKQEKKIQLQQDNIIQTMSNLLNEDRQLFLNKQNQKTKLKTQKIMASINNDQKKQYKTTIHSKQDIQEFNMKLENKQKSMNNQQKNLKLKKKNTILSELKDKIKSKELKETDIQHKIQTENNNNNAIIEKSRKQQQQIDSQSNNFKNKQRIISNKQQKQAKQQLYQNQVQRNIQFNKTDYLLNGWSNQQNNHILKQNISRNSIDNHQIPQHDKKLNFSSHIDSKFIQKNKKILPKLQHISNRQKQTIKCLKDNQNGYRNSATVLNSSNGQFLSSLSQKLNRKENLAFSMQQTEKKYMKEIENLVSNNQANNIQKIQMLVKFIQAIHHRQCGESCIHLNKFYQFLKRKNIFLRKQLLMTKRNVLFDN